MKLQQISVKWNNKIILINEYLTSKTFSNCRNIDYNLDDCMTLLFNILNNINLYINQFFIYIIIFIYKYI